MDEGVELSCLPSVLINNEMPKECDAMYTECWPGGEGGGNIQLFTNKYDESNSDLIPLNLDLQTTVISIRLIFKNYLNTYDEGDKKVLCAFAPDFGS